jgi:hypothetical protein
MLLVPRPLAIVAVRQLAQADYSIATKLSDLVAETVPWALTHEYYWLADASIAFLTMCDDLGSLWIVITAWLIHHTHP